LPFLSDSEEQVEETIKTVKEYGADFIFVGGLTLFGKGPADCKALYYKFLEKYHPELVPKYKSLYRIFFAPSKEYQKELEENQGGCVRNMELSNGGFGAERFVASLLDLTSFGSYNTSIRLVSLAQIPPLAELRIPAKRYMKFRTPPLEIV